MVFSQKNSRSSSGGTWRSACLQKCGGGAVMLFFENCANNQSPLFRFPRRELEGTQVVPRCMERRAPRRKFQSQYSKEWI